MKILIGIPSTRGLFTAGCFGSMVDMVSTLRKEGHEVVISILTQALVSRGRDILASRALRGGYDYLWMIDDDMQWGDDVFEAFWVLMGRKAPIIAVAAPARQHKAETQGDMHFYTARYPVRFKPESEREIKYSAQSSPRHDALAGESGSIRIREAVTVGTGFMAISTAVFKALVETGKIPCYIGGFDPQDKETWRFFAEEMVKNDQGENVLLGEDESFVAKAREWCRFPTIVPVDVEIGHEGMHMFKGRVSDHMGVVIEK